MQKPFIRSPYNYDRDIHSAASELVCDDPSLTDQSQAKDADINNIMEKFGKTGLVPTNLRTALPDEFIEAFDYQSALNGMMQADAAFADLPSQIRARFSNDPAELLEFLQDPRNRDEAIRLGIVNKPAETPQATPAADTSTPPKGD